MNDPFNLSRFVGAQRPVFSQVMDELRAGRKTRHWMWFIFPQLRGLGHSATAQHFALSGGDEARAYLQHDLLGPRLEECVGTLLSHHGMSARQILGSPDDIKLRSCLTLFVAVRAQSTVYQQALDHYYSGQPDDKTLRLLDGDAQP